MTGWPTHRECSPRALRAGPRKEAKGENFISFSASAPRERLKPYGHHGDYGQPAAALPLAALRRLVLPMRPLAEMPAATADVLPSVSTFDVAVFA